MKSNKKNKKKKGRRIKIIDWEEKYDEIIYWINVPSTLVYTINYKELNMTLNPNQFGVIQNSIQLEDFESYRRP